MTTTEGTEMTTARGYSAILENVNLTVKETVEKILRINFYLDADAGTGEVSGFKACDHVHLPSSYEDVDGIQNFHNSVNQFIADAKPVRDHIFSVSTAVCEWRNMLVEGAEMESQRRNLMTVLYVIKSKFDVLNTDIETMEKIRDNPHYLDNYFENEKKKKAEPVAFSEKEKKKMEEIASVLASAPEGID